MYIMNIVVSHCAVNVSAPLGLPGTLRHHTWWAQHLAFRRRRRAGNKRAQKHFILGSGLFGLLPDSILEGVGDSLCSSTNRYTYTVNVSNMHNIGGREQVDALRSECWEEAWEARR